MVTAATGARGEAQPDILFHLAGWRADAELEGVPDIQVFFVRHTQVIDASAIASRMPYSVSCLHAS